MRLRQKSKNVRRMVGIGLVIVMMGVMSVAIVAKLFTLRDGVMVDLSQADAVNKTPELSVETMISGLDHPWEIAFLPDGTMLVTERGGDISRIDKNTKVLVHAPEDVIARGEGGLMGLAVDAEFASNRYVYFCYNSLYSSDIVVRRIKLNDQVTGMTESKVIIPGIPMAQSGRHSGCRLGFGADGNLWVGTGDAADEDTPQDLNSLGGKILRVDREGKGVSGNSTDGDSRIYSYGHRNVQGLAFYDQPINGSYGMSLEHGPRVDDEANELRPGNFGWAPRADYDESVPMTDTSRFPDAIGSVWSSGDPTIATADADFLRGQNWGAWEGRLAVGVLKDRHLRLLEIKDGRTSEQLQLFNGEYGRIRAVTMGRDGSLYISTDNGRDDKILKITPSL